MQQLLKINYRRWICTKTTQQLNNSTNDRIRLFNLGSKFLSCLTVCFLVFSSSHADRVYDDDDVETLANYSMDDEEWSDAKEKFMDNEYDTGNLLNQQKSFIKKVYQGIEDSPESIIALKDLTDNDLEITKESFNSIKDNPDVALLRVDMYKGANLPTMILKGIEFQEKSLNAENDDRFQSLLSTLKDSLSTLCRYETGDFADKNYFRDYGEVLSCFNNLIVYVDKDPNFSKEFSDFVEFIQLSQKFTNLLYVRYNTENVICYKSFIRGNTSCNQQPEYDSFRKCSITCCRVNSQFRLIR